jgi:BolA family transcriptional regulator, general stress-responsive regulator
MTTVEQITQRLTQALAPQHLTVRDDSEGHRGHGGFIEGVTTHVHLEVVSNQFAGLNRVARQRLVYQALGDLMDNPLHAVAIAAKAPGEA